MPGTVISVDVAVGDMVAAGQACAVVEAMKMQNALTVSRDGKVKVILLFNQFLRVSCSSLKVKPYFASL